MQEEIKNDEPLTKEETLKLLNGLIGLFSNKPKEVVYKEDYDILQNRINKAIEIYENRNTIKYKKKRFMEDKSSGALMYEALKGR